MSTVNDDIRIIGQGLDWLKQYKPEQYEQSFIQMVDGRRRLLRQKAAMKENPAIGAFGESQTGKSYQINTLLNRKDKPFRIRSTKRPEGVGFVDEINPIGDDREATGVVTRLTSFLHNPERYNPDYPVIVKLLTPGQLVCILASGYFSNIRDYTTYESDELKKISAEIYQKYINRPEIENPRLTADDILDIKAYLMTYQPTGTQEMTRSKLFESMARIIDRVPAAEWVTVVKYLWHSNEAISSLFERLVSDLTRLDFAPEVYVPLETVMHGGKNMNTIMSVACLNGLDDDNWALRTPIYIKGESGLREIGEFRTCDLCAISAEVIFKIDPEYLDEDLSYYYNSARSGEAGELPEESLRKLSKKVDKSLLRDTDLLDFPGARSPEQQDEKNCTRDNCDDSGQSVLVKLFLRGKIAYLFNHYSESHMMKVLLFCHHHKQSEVKNLHLLIDQWVRRNVGSTVEERSATLNRTGGISPLMVVATKINIDMTHKDKEVFNSETALNTRWEDRFRTVLLDAVLNWTNADWYKNWNAPGQSFRDTYLLRSYAYSADTGQGNGMFEGYDESKASPESRLKMDADFYRLLRRTFVANRSVHELFTDPELAWDVAATTNNDGSLYIIERMGKVARAASAIRDEQMARERGRIMRDVRSILEAEFDADDDNERLMQNIDTVSDIRWEMDTACNDDDYYFGHLLQAMHVTEVECLEVVHSLIHDTRMATDISNLSEYQIIRKRCDDFAGCTTLDQKWERLMAAYHWRDRQRATAQLERRNINTDILFSDSLRPKTNQTYIADSIIELWHDKLRSQELMNTFTAADGFSPVLMKDLIKTLIDSADRLHLADRIAEKIESEVAVANKAEIRESLVADMMATLINSFVNDFGYSLLSDEQREKARLIADENGLEIFDYIGRPRKAEYTHEELSDLFAALAANAGALTQSFENNYNAWIEYITVAYIVHLKRSELPPEVNKALGDLISAIEL